MMNDHVSELYQLGKAQVNLPALDAAQVKLTICNQIQEDNEYLSYLAFER